MKRVWQADTYAPCMTGGTTSAKRTIESWRTGFEDGSRLARRSPRKNCEFAWRRWGVRGCGQAIRAVARLHLQEFDEGRRRTRSRECKPAPRKVVAHSVFRVVWTLTSGLPRRNRIKTDQVSFLELALVGGTRKEPFAIHGIVGELVRTCANSLSQELFGIFAPSEVLSDKSCISCRAIGGPCRTSH